MYQYNVQEMLYPIQENISVQNTSCRNENHENELYTEHVHAHESPQSWQGKEGKEDRLKVNKVILKMVSYSPCCYFQIRGHLGVLQRNHMVGCSLSDGPRVRGDREEYL
jgi:hypothetical protein